MVKPLHTDRPKKVTVSLPESLHQQVHLLLLDPLHARTRYGTLSGLMTTLLRDWIDKQRKENTDGRSSATSGSEGESPTGGGRSLGRVLDGSERTQTEPSSDDNEEGKGEEGVEPAG